MTRHISADCNLAVLFRAWPFAMGRYASVAAPDYSRSSCSTRFHLFMLCITAALKSSFVISRWFWTERAPGTGNPALTVFTM
jgi:hypothetical protein